jgi:hypothetical protein
MNQVSRISAISDAAAGGLVSQGTLADLAEQIMATPAEPSAGPAQASLAARCAPGARRVPATRRAPAAPAARSGPAARRAPTAPAARRARARRRALIGVPAAAGLAAAALIAMSLAGPGQKIGPVTIGPPPARAAALSFAPHGGYIDVIVRNPVAGPATYRAEFAAHHLRVTLRMLPVSPSLVGTLLYAGTSPGSHITTITARGKCWTGGGGNACPVGVRIPAGFRGSADFAFGRAARPGEQYASTGLVTAPGEAMHGLHYKGRTVTAVLAMLAARHLTVPQYRFASPGSACGSLPRHIPGTWRVYDADPWAPGQILLWVGPPAGAARAPCPAPANQPVPSPSSSAVR